MIIHRLHYRHLNSYLACYFHHIKQVPLQGTHVVQAVKIKKDKLTKSRIKIMGAMA
jgi:hypothetical protein